MAELFKRRASLLVGSTRITDLRIAFTVDKMGGREPNKATIAVTNLSQQTRAAFEVKGLRVVLEAGYLEQSGAIFIGSTYLVKHRREGADVVTTIEGADGGEEVTAAIGSWSFASGSSAASAVRTVAAGLGLPLSTGSRINPLPAVLAKGFATAGLASDALDDITRATGLTWSIEDGQVQILDAVAGDGSGDIVLNADRGMIGSPERTEVKDEKTKKKKQRVLIRALIQPRIRPRRLLLVTSIDVPQLSGRYEAKTVRITGDTHGADWTMAIEAAPV
jgi:hypothetical protein